jgi:CheY-like chemotaxis protein
MTIATQMLNAAMPELRGRYATRLRTQSGELLDFISRCERGKLTSDRCREVRLLVHSLCGTGRTFGFPEISDAASRLEAAIERGSLHDPQTYIELTLRLLRACDPAIQTAGLGNLTDEGDSISPNVLERPRLLCMSDDAATIAILHQMFGARMEIVSTADQIEALDLIRFSNPAAVIFDMGAEHFMAGLEALNSECANQSVPLIAIAPSRQAAAVAHAMSAGAVQCVVKPISAEKLYHCAHTCIERGRLTVLVADDDVIVREMVVNRFKAAGLSVIPAGDGAMVLDLAARHRPSIIVLDRIMPGIEGVAILRMLKANPLTHEIPVIILSAKRKTAEIAEARRAGAVDYIVKPFNPDQIVQRCIHELGLSRQPKPEHQVVKLATARRLRRVSYPPA